MLSIVTVYKVISGVMAVLRHVREKLEDALAATASRYGVKTLKGEQGRIIRTFVEGNDVFVSFPTGYGKSLCYGILPWVRDIVRESQSSVLCV